MTYNTAGVRSFGRGLFSRTPVRGADTSYRRLYRLHTDQVVLSQLFAWEGAVSLVPPEFDGWFVSSEFPTFTVNSRRILPSYVAHFVRWSGLHDQLRDATRGLGQRRQRVHVEDLLAIRIPLPPIGEQRRIAEKLDRLHGTTEHLRQLSDLASALAGALTVSLAARPDLDDVAKARAGWRRARLGSLMTQASDRESVDPELVYLNAGIYSFGRGMFTKAGIDGSTTSANVLHRIRKGQFIYSRLFAFEGAYTYVPAEFDGYFVSNEFPSFDVDPDQLDARWLANYLRSPNRWAELGGASKGIGVRRKRVPVDAVLQYDVWLPPIADQREIVTRIDLLDRVRTGRSECVNRFASLVPAALNRAFGSPN